MNFLISVLISLLVVILAVVYRMKNKSRRTNQEKKKEISIEKSPSIKKVMNNRIPNEDEEIVEENAFKDKLDSITENFKNKEEKVEEIKKETKEIKKIEPKKPRIEIKRDEMIEFTSIEKQIWRLILSKLEFKDFFQISTICKRYFFLLKEDEVLWSLFVIRNTNIKSIPPQYDSWKQLMLSIYLSEWDTSKFEDHFSLDPNDNRILQRSSDKIYYHWKTALLKNHLFEGVLYPFKIVGLPPEGNVTVGVSKDKKDCSMDHLFGVDKNMFGYYYFLPGQTTYSCNNGNGTSFSSFNWCEGGTVYLLIHKGSYNEKTTSKATVSFFMKQKEKDTPLYQFSFKDIELEPGEKLFGFISYCRADSFMRLEDPVFNFDEGMFPPQYTYASHL